MDTRTLDILRQNSVPESALQKFNLTGIHLARRNLVGADLRGFTVTRTNFERADLTGADLRGIQFAEANCVSASFSGADLRGARLGFGFFHGADFRGADLRGAQVKDAVCNGCNFAGADLRGAQLGHEHYDSDFRGADLRGAQIPDDSDFGRLNCDIRGALVTPREAPTDQNMRRAPRVTLTKPLRVFDRSTGKQAGVVVDITTEGIRISGNNTFPVDKRFSFQIQLPEGTAYGRSCNLEAQSVWCQPIGSADTFNAGFHIHKIDERDLTIIGQIIKDQKNRGFAIVDT